MSQIGGYITKEHLIDREADGDVDLEVPVGADYAQTITIPENKYKSLVEYKQI
jgi:hypothetical protein